MSSPQPATVRRDRSRSSQPRARRVLSERLTARRAKVLEHLVDPPIVAETVELLTTQANDIYRAFKPRNGWQDWLTSEIAVIMVRINRCSRIERKLRDYAAYRAIDFWEEDQALEVATVAAKLERDPTRVVARLRQSPAGCDWLLQRWRALAEVAPPAWTDAQRTLAGRLGGEDADPTKPGYAAGQVGALEAQRERVEEADAIVRGLVEADLSDEVPGLARLRRYSRSLHRQMKWYIDQFHVEHPDRWDDPMRQPAFVAHDLLDQQRARKSTWNFAEPTPPPPTVTATTATTETKPPATTPVSHPRFAETKPSVRVELQASLAAAVPQPPVSEEVAAPEPPPSAAESPRRRDRVSPAREAARRDKAARRRAALAGTSWA